MKNSYTYWLDRWSKSKIFSVENDHIKQKSYLFSSFPKTNILGFQNGNIRPVLIGDFYSRYQRMNNFNVMYPVGYDSLGLQSFLENKKMSNIINDDISLIFKDQLLKLGIGIDENKEIDLKHREYLNVLQHAFIDLYEKGYIKYDNVVVYQDSEQKKIIDSYYRNSELSPNRVKAFYLDISNCHKEISDKITELNVDESIKNELLSMLEPNRSVDIEFALTNGTKINVNMKNPEYMGGISFIAIHPDCVELEEYISIEELSSLENYLSEDNTNDFGLFTGNYAINPLTGNKIPVFISVNYNEEIHIGNTYLSLEDYKLANEEGIRIVDIVQDGVMINSDFLNGVDVEKAKDVLIDAFLDAGMCIAHTYYDKKEILVSSSDTLGALIPFLKDSDNKIYSLKKHLPFEFSPQFRPILGNDVDVPGRTIDGSINHLFSTGMLPILSLIYDGIGGSSSIFSKETINMFNKWDGINIYSIMKNELYVGVFIPCVILAIIEKEKGVKLPPLFRKLFIIEETVDINENSMNRSNGNIFDLNKLINKYSADSIRMYFLYKPLDKFVYLEEQLIYFNDLLKEIEEYYNEFTLDNSIGIKFNEAVERCNKHISNNETHLYVNSVVELFEEVLRGNKPTYDQALLFLKLLYPIVPFLADDIHKEIFNGKYLISDDGWI